MLGYIYRTTNLINGKVYIGQCASSKFKPKYYGSGATLKKALHKYGLDSFTIKLLVECNTKAELDAEEIRLIAEHRAKHGRKNCYNITNGGEGALGVHASAELRRFRSEKAKAHRHSSETIQKLSECKKGALNPNYRKKPSVGTLVKCQATKRANRHLHPPRRGFKRSAESVQKQRATVAQRGRSLAQQATAQRLGLSQAGKPKSLASVLKRSAARRGGRGPMTGRKHSPESIDRMRKIRSLQKHLPHTLESKAQMSVTQKEWRTRRRKAKTEGRMEEYYAEQAERLRLRRAKSVQDRLEKARQQKALERAQLNK